eukprot:scaffold401_cov144-Skeletonema_dohrnii-CCMP3373.AAC.17
MSYLQISCFRNLPQRRNALLLPADHTYSTLISLKSSIWKCQNVSASLQKDTCAVKYPCDLKSRGFPGISISKMKSRGIPGISIYCV